MDFSQFASQVEKNSVDLIRNRAELDSSLQDYRSSMSWNTSYIESEISMGKPHSSGDFQVESTTLLMITPRLPWVTAILKQSLQTKTLQYDKSYRLMKNLAIIEAKRIYFSYTLAEEKYKIYQQREQNFLSQLKIAEAKFKSGSLAKKDYVNFKNSYYEARLLRMQIQQEIVNLRNALLKMLGLSQVDGAIRVSGLDFKFFDIRGLDLETRASQSLLLEILALNAKDNAINAKASSYERWDSFEIGAGLQNTTQGNLSQNFATLRVQVPIPLTRKYDHLKKKYLILQSSYLRQEEVQKRNLKIQALSYGKQLEIKQDFIKLQKENVDNKRSLVDMGKTAYEAQKISLFEYLAYQNAYMDGLIKMIDAKLEYVQVQTLLEESLGMILFQGKNNE